MEKYEREQAMRQKLKEAERRKKVLEQHKKATEAALRGLKKTNSSSTTTGGNNITNEDEEDEGALSDTDLGDSDDDLEDDMDEDDEDDDVKLKDAKAVLFGSTQGKTFHKMTERNLRIREHTAKYLLNLDPNSAHYDPKSRSMRSNPRPQDSAEEATFSGDNFVRHNGDVSEMAKTQLFAWEAYNKGEDAAHLQANPTQVELARKQFHQTKEKMLAAKKKKRMEKYGGSEHMTTQSHQERFGEESSYVEYDARGNVVKGFEKAAPRSKYVEDQHPHGHTSVWGSYYDREVHKWGYSCCWQTSKNAFCVGEDGKAAIREGKIFLKEQAAQEREQGGGTGVNHANAADKKREERPSISSVKGVARSDGWSRDDDFDALGRNRKIDDAKLKEALKEEEQRQRKRSGRNEEESSSAAAAAQRPTGFGKADESVEVVEAKRLMRERANDPMANLADDEVLPMEEGGGVNNEMLRQTA